MSKEQNEFFQNLDADNISPEQAAQMLEMGWEGDTGTPEPETGSETPDASTETVDDAAAQEQEQPESEEPPTEQATEGNEPDPVVLAKDGKHTIPYEKLVEAREGEKHWRAQAEAAAKELESLREQAQARADAGEEATETDKNAAIAQDAIDNGIDPDLFGDFTEEDLAKGVNKLIELKLDEKLRQMSETQQTQQAQQSASEAHYGAIYEAHPDADSIAESAELANWIDSQPGHVKIGIQSVLEKGSAQQVIEVFDSFKQATGKTQQADGAPAGDVKAAAKAAIDSAEEEVPTSLSDIPGGRSGAASLEEQVAGLEGRDLLERMEGMPPEKIESLLNKLI